MDETTILISIISWVVLCIVVGAVASSMGRKSGVYFAISFFLSPLIGFIILAIKGRPTKEEQFYMAERLYLCTQCRSIFKHSGSEPCLCKNCNKAATPTSVLLKDWEKMSIEQQKEMKKAFAQGEYLIQSPESIQSEAPAHSSPTSYVSQADEIRKFKELLDMGAITEEEYNAKKKQILGL